MSLKIYCTNPSWRNPSLFIMCRNYFREDVFGGILILSWALLKAQAIGMQSTCVTMNRNVIHLNELEFLSPKDIFCLVWLVLEEIFKCLQCIFAILLLSSLGKGMTLYLHKLLSPLPKDTFCQVWFKLAHWFLSGREDF